MSSRVRRRLGHATVLLFLGLLLTGIEKGRGFPHEARQVYGVASVTIVTPSTTTVGAGNHTQYVVKKESRSCKVCQTIVIGLKKYIEKIFRRRSAALCGKLIPELWLKCMKDAKIYKDLVIRKLFPGSAKDTCKKFNICKKK